MHVTVFWIFESPNSRYAISKGRSAIYITVCKLQCFNGPTCTQLYTGQERPRVGQRHCFSCTLRHQISLNPTHRRPVKAGFTRTTGYYTVVSKNSDVTLINVYISSYVQIHILRTYYMSSPVMTIFSWAISNRKR